MMMMIMMMAEVGDGDEVGLGWTGREGKQGKARQGKAIYPSGGGGRFGGEEACSAG